MATNYSTWARGPSSLPPVRFSTTKSHSEEGTGREQGCQAGLAWAPAHPELAAWMEAFPVPQPVPVVRGAQLAESLSAAQIRRKPLVSLQCLNSYLSRLPSVLFRTATGAAFYLNS